MGGYGSGPYGWLGKTSKKTTDSCLNVDVNRWNREGLLRPGSSFTATWTRNPGNEKSSIRVRAYSDSVVLSYVANGEDIEYTVLLTRTSCNYGNTRPWFICPGKNCGKRVAKLYMQGKYFLCRHCHDLTYESCQESGKVDARMARKAGKIKRKLGVKGPTGFMDGLIWIDKPKYMHWDTYSKLNRELREVQEAGIRAIASSLGLTARRLAKAAGK